MRSVLLIDDEAAHLEELAQMVGATLRTAGSALEVRTWRPTTADAGNPQGLRAVFNNKVDAETVLVVTDQDLTSAGCTGLFGSSIVAWCRTRFIPVWDYSRHVGSLPSQPDLFEMRVPTDPAEAAKFIATVCDGFARLSDPTIG